MSTFCWGVFEYMVVIKIWIQLIGQKVTVQDPKGQMWPYGHKLPTTIKDQTVIAVFCGQYQATCLHFSMTFSWNPV